MANRYNPSSPTPQPSQKLPGVERPQPSGSSASSKLPGPTTPSVPEFQGPLPNQQTPQLPPPTAAGAGPVLPQGNGPIFPDQQSQIAFNGSYYNPTTAPFGYDMSQPGQREQFWANNQQLWFQNPQLDWIDDQLPQFADPWQGEQKVGDIMSTIANPGAGQQYWTGVQGEFNSMGNNVIGGYKGPNNSQEAYGMTKGMLPGSLQPQFDAYYDRMKQKNISDVNSQSAARGAYGSNTALNGAIGASLDAEAQRAKAATDFMLADSANQANWQGILGNQARNADLSGLDAYGKSLEGARFGLDKIKLGGDLAFESEGMDFDKKKSQAELAFGIDEHRRDRLGAGIETALASHGAHQKVLNDAYEASGRAQDAFENRTGNLYDDIGNFEGDVMSYFSQNYDDIINMDAETFQQQISTMVGQAADQRGWSQQQQERIMRDAKAIYDAIKGQQGENVAAGTKTG